MNSSTPPANVVHLKPMMEKIIIAACQHFGCTEDELMKVTKEPDITYRRNICYYLIKQNVMISHKRIARRFGFSAHSSVSRQVENIDVQKNIYAPLSHDLRSIMIIANNLDIQFTTHGVDAK